MLRTKQLNEVHLPDSDETPADNKLQDLIPGLLKAILALIWSERRDWFFGVDMGVYYDAKKPAIVSRENGCIGTTNQEKDFLHLKNGLLKLKNE